MSVKGPELQTIKRAHEKGQKCCNGTQPHFHDGFNQQDRSHQLEEMQQ